MIEIGLSDDQRALVEAEESLFAAACPGAGKTRAMVARFLKRTSEEPRKGIALISFTNTAVDEVRRRCGDQTESLTAPHFVGTFDAFLHRFVVSPHYVAIYKVAPRYIQSWDESAGTSFRMGIPGASDVQLDWFDFDHSGKATLIMDRVTYRRFGNAEAIKKLETHRQQAEGRATGIFRALLKAGTVSCDTARLLAKTFIEQRETWPIIAELLKARFAEVIVDEAQDCGHEELTVLAFLRECGIRIVMVGDIDQAIYEFRKAMPSAVRDFAQSLPRRLEIKENWRSSRSICALNNALRSGSLVETATGPAADVEAPVQLIEFSWVDEIVPAAIRLAKEYNLAARDLMLLAHAGNHGMKAAGVTGTKDFDNRVLAIADAGFKLRSANFDASARLESIKRVERAVLDALTNGINPAYKSLEGMCDDLRIDVRWLRKFAVRMATALNGEGKNARDFAMIVREFLKAANWDDVTPPAFSDLGKLFKAPPETAWLKVSNQRADPLVPYSTVHGVKGMEFKGVVLLMPEKPKKHEITGRTALEDWEGGHDSEARRVLYVACSRAKQLLILAVHRKHVERVAGLLDANEVPYVRS